MNKNKIVKAVLCAALIGTLGYCFVAKSETKLIPFQGKLTDASGQVISDGAIVVQFKMYDAPVGGQAKWNGEVQMLTVNGGLVNTTLGTKASLKNVDFSSPTYLEITIDANGDNEIGPEDPPLLPRQSIIPAVYAVKAGDAKTLSGYGWSAVFSNGDPETGTINGAKLTAKSVSTAQIANNAVTANQVANGAITSAKLANGAVTSNQLAKNSVTATQVADGEITTAKLAEKAVTSDKIAEKEVGWKHRKPRMLVNNSLEVEPQIGQIVRGESITATSSNQVVEGSKVRLNTSGGAVHISLEGAEFRIGTYSVMTVQIVRDGQIIYSTNLGVDNPHTGSWFSPSSVSYIDNPPAGLHEYKYIFKSSSNYGATTVVSTRIVAYEL